MKCRLVELYTHGVRRDPQEVLAAEPLVGDLVIENCRRSPRWTRLAELKEHKPGYTRPMLPPLSDPVAVRAKPGDNGFVLRGCQLSARTVDGEPVITEFIQEWWIRPG
jgi:hypothetical protein